MSLFLGNIHYWLYHKINWLDSFEDRLVDYGNDKGMNMESLLSDLYQKYDQPKRNAPLEQVIDESNIHGWLQARINESEKRHASLITQLLSEDGTSLEELKSIFHQKGIADAKEAKGQHEKPEELYATVNNYILEGMPCDRVSVPENSTEDEFTWSTAECLHEAHWKEVGGDISNFYTLRDEWIRGFVSTLHSDFTYRRINPSKQTIERKVS